MAKRPARGSLNCLLLLAVFQIICTFTGRSANAAPLEAHGICEAAAATASKAENVPLPVLLAVALTETGRTRDGRFAPWPWTANTGDRGHWFSTRAEAVAFANRTLAEGRQSFDTGCFQINYRWHGHYFTSIDEMFDPDRNAVYAARFLRDLYLETGSWSEAAGAYHSRTDSLANAYRARFDRHYARLVQNVYEPPPLSVRPMRLNTFPLLKGGGHPASPGSLFQIGSDRG